MEVCFSPDKFDRNFIASFHQDAFSLAITMIRLIETQKTITMGILKDCKYDNKIYGVCTTQFLHCVKNLIEATNLIDFKNLFGNLQNHFFNVKESSNTSQMIGRMPKLYGNLPHCKNDDGPSIKKLIEIIKSQISY